MVHNFFLPEKFITKSLELGSRLLRVQHVLTCVALTGHLYPKVDVVGIGLRLGHIYIYIYIYIYQENQFDAVQQYVFGNCRIALHVSAAFCVHLQEHQELYVYCVYTQSDSVQKPSTLGRLAGYLKPFHVTRQRLLLQCYYSPSAPEDGRKKRPKRVEQFTVANKHTARLHRVGFLYIYQASFSSVK